MHSSQKDPLQRLLKITGIPLMVLLAGFMAVLIPKWFGIHFVPTPDSFTSQLGLSLWIIGAILALPVAYLIFAIAYLGYTPAHANNAFYRKPGKIMGLFGPPFILFMGGCLMEVFFKVFIPLAHASIFSGPVSHDFVVTDTFVSSSRRACLRGIEVDTGNFLFSEVCGVPTEFRRTLEKGDAVTISGKGSSSGIFYKTIELKQ